MAALPADHNRRGGWKREKPMLDEAVFTAGDLMTRDVAVVHPETSTPRGSRGDGAAAHQRRAGARRRGLDRRHAQRR